MSLPILIGMSWGIWEEQRKQEKHNELFERARAGDKEAYFEWRGIDIKNEKVQKQLLTFHDPGGLKDYMKEASRVKSMSYEERSDYGGTMEFMQFINNHTLQELQQMLDDYTLDARLYNELLKEREAIEEKIKNNYEDAGFHWSFWLLIGSTFAGLVYLLEFQ